MYGEKGGRGGGRDRDRDGNGGDGLNQCACHISIPWDPCFLILLASWLFVLPVCPRWHLKVSSSFRGPRGDTTLVGIQLQLSLIPSPSAYRDICMQFHLMQCWSERIGFTLSKHLCVNSNFQSRVNYKASSTNISICA